MMKEVNFQPIEGAINDRIDEAYRAKYWDSRNLGPMIGGRARSARIEITPCDNGARGASVS